ncbi:hypothetical protein, partial [Bradyrhizobium guangdongense]|uniref:hypothetical protein n=1 Tax=Bradyrhizobium guangdongense TaxID=1325090 RepID=UPI001AECD9A0
AERGRLLTPTACGRLYASSPTQAVAAQLSLRQSISQDAQLRNLTFQKCDALKQNVGGMGSSIRNTHHDLKITRMQNDPGNPGITPADGRNCKANHSASAHSQPAKTWSGGCRFFSGSVRADAQGPAGSRWRASQ